MFLNPLSLGDLGVILIISSQDFFFFLNQNEFMFTNRFFFLVSDFYWPWAGHGSKSFTSALLPLQSNFPFPSARIPKETAQQLHLISWDAAPVCEVSFWCGTMPRGWGSYFQSFISMVTAGKPPPPTPPFPGTLNDFPKDNAACGGGFLCKRQGVQVGEWSWLDKAGRFYPPAVSHCLVLVLSSLPW